MMISGVVNEDLEATIPLSILDGHSQMHRFVGVIDTGFSGWLTLPESAMNDLELPWICRQRGELADGSIATFDVFEAQLLWDGRRVSVQVESAETVPLVGMQLLNGYSLRVSVRPDGPVAIESEP